MPKVQGVTGYADGVEKIAKNYGPRVMKLLSTLRVRLQDAGFEVDGPDYTCCEDYRWSLVIHRPGAPVDLYDVIDLSVRLDESVDYDGIEEGINWSFDVVHASGRIVGGCTPCNYTPRVWVEWRSLPAVEKRWQLLGDAMLDGDVAGSLREWFVENPREGAGCTSTRTPSA